MNNVLLIPLIGASLIISVMSLEDVFNNSSCFNGPAFDSNALSWNVDSDIISVCNGSCGGSVGCEPGKK